MRPGPTSQQWALLLWVWHPLWVRWPNAGPRAERPPFLARSLEHQTAVSVCLSVFPSAPGPHSHRAGPASATLLQCLGYWFLHLTSFTVRGLLLISEMPPAPFTSDSSYAIWACYQRRLCVHTLFSKLKFHLLQPLFKRPVRHAFFPTSISSFWTLTSSQGSCETWSPTFSSGGSDWTRTKPGFPALQAESLPSESPGKHNKHYTTFTIFTSLLSEEEI